MPCELYRRQPALWTQTVASMAPVMLVNASATMVHSYTITVNLLGDHCHPWCKISGPSEAAHKRWGFRYVTALDLIS